MQNNLSNHSNDAQNQHTEVLTAENTNTSEVLNLNKDMSVDAVFQVGQQELQNSLEAKREILKNDAVVVQLVQTLNVQNKNDVLSFGHAPSVEVSKFADKILHSTKKSDLEDSTELLNKLAKLMKQFDPKDFEEPKGGFFSRIVNNTKKQVEKLMAKYQTVGKEIDDIYVQVESYKNEMVKINDDLEGLHQNLFMYFEELEKYIVAGNIILEELRTQDLPHYERLAEGGTQEDMLMLQEVKDTIELLSTRVYDLELAKMAAFQTAPQIRLMQRTNNKIIGKIHSAFIVTIPVFKTNLIQAITLKRSKLANDSLDALSAETNRMLRENAINTMNQSVHIASTASDSMIDSSVLEENMKTILDGMAEVKAIELEKEKQREEGLKRVHSAQENFKQAALNHSANN